MSNLSFEQVDTEHGTYWRVLWRGRAAGLIVPTGEGDGTRLFKITSSAITEIGQADGYEEAKAFFERKEREAVDGKGKG